MSIINKIFDIPGKTFMFFMNMVWKIITIIFKIIWDRHMISIWDYFNAWKNPLSFIPRLIKGIIFSLKDRPSWSSRLYKFLNLLSLGILSRLDPNPPNPTVPLIFEGGFYFCHLVILISLIILMTKIWSFFKKFEK